jgi:hypothetical protein
VGQLTQPELRETSECGRLSVSDLISARTLSRAVTQATTEHYDDGMVTQRGQLEKNC